MWRNSELARGRGFLIELAVFTIISGIGSFIVQAIWNRIGAGIFGFQVATFWEIAGFLYITCTLINAWISREALLKSLRGWWGWACWKYHSPMAALIFFLRLMLVLAILAILAAISTMAWNRVVIRLRPLTFQGVLIVLLIAAFPYLMFLDWLDLGKGLWRKMRRF